MNIKLLRERMLGCTNFEELETFIDRFQAYTMHNICSIDLEVPGGTEMVMELLAGMQKIEFQMDNLRKKAYREDIDD